MRKAIRIVQEAVDSGMTFLDNAWEYHDGKSEEARFEGPPGRQQHGFPSKEEMPG